MQNLPLNIARYVQPLNRALWYWEIAELKQYVAANGIDTAMLQSEGLKEAARLLHRKGAELGHEEIHYFALQLQTERNNKHGARMWHMQCDPQNKVQE